MSLMSNSVKNFSIGKKLFIAFGLICLLFGVAGIVIGRSTHAINNSIEKVENEILPNTMNFIEIKKDILQAQEWLTDIAATRAAKGYDDGYGEAEKYFNDAVKRVEFAIKEYEAYGDKDMVALLRKMQESLDAYYKVGKETAQAYIDGGPEKGNPMMDKFDPYVEKLSGIIDKFDKDHQQKLNHSFREISAQSSSAIKMLIILIVVVLVFSVLIALFISSDIKTRVNLIKEAFSKSAQGDLTATVNSDAKDEIGIISDGYNAFIAQLCELIKNIIQSAETITGSSTRLSSVSQKMSDKSVQTSENANTVAAAAEEMSTNMNSVASATEQTTANLQMVVSAAEEMTATIQEIANNTAKGSEITQDAVNHAKMVSGKVDELGKAAQEISKVTESISDISEQTNLLALNATIEAARAGEAGKGFAVVAGEIKVLAQQTAEATLEINSKISGVQNTTKESVAAIKTIVDVINEINAIVTTIATAIEEQSATTKEISNNVSQAASGVQEVNENVNQASAVTGEVTRDIANISQAADEMNTDSDTVNQSSRELLKLAEDLNEMVSQFKI